MSADLINSLFESIAGFMMLLNVMTLHRHKEVKGFHLAPTVFFTIWGYWNIYYYPHLNQWYSFIGGIWIVIVNTAYVLLTIYYLKRSKQHG